MKTASNAQTTATTSTNRGCRYDSSAAPTTPIQRVSGKTTHNAALAAAGVEAFQQFRYDFVHGHLSRVKKKNAPRRRQCRPGVVARGGTAVGKRPRPGRGAALATAEFRSGHGELRAHREQLGVHAVELRDDDLDPVAVVVEDEGELVAARVHFDGFR